MTTKLDDVRKEATAVRDIIIKIGEVAQETAQLRWQMKRLERFARREATGRNQQERDDAADDLVEGDPAWNQFHEELETAEGERSLLEADLAYHKYMTRAFIAMLEHDDINALTYTEVPR